MQIIQVENVTKTYKIGEVETHALNGVSLDVEQWRIHRPGRPFRFRQDHPAATDRRSGQTRQRRRQDQRAGCHQPQANKRADLRKEEIGFIFQFFALIPVLNAYENVELPLAVERRGRQRTQRTG